MDVASKLPDAIDLLICGGGSAGAALAGIVARDTDQNVVLLEAGPDYGALNEGNWPDDVLDARTLCLSHQWGYYGTAHPTHRSWTGYDRAKVIGGCSSHNGCVALLGHRNDYNHWAEIGNTGWDWDSVKPAFERAKSSLRVRNIGSDEVTPWQQAFIDGAVATGIPRSADLNDPDEVAGVNTSPVNIFEGIRWNSALAYLDPVRQRRNLTIIGDALVDRVVVRNGRAVAVDVIVGGSQQTIAAERIVLAAGAYGSPAILLRSGIGPEQHLSEVGVSVVHRLEGVGSGLTDHPAVTVTLDQSSTLSGAMRQFQISGWLPDEQALAKAQSSTCDSAFDLHLYAVSGKSPSTGDWQYAIWVACVEPWSSGSVRLASTKPSDAPIIDHGFLNDPDAHDLQMLVDGIEIASDIMSTNVFTDLFGLGPGAMSRDDMADFVRESVGIYYHPACSCRMGPASDSQAVVSPAGQVHGIDDLYVCDASIFPVIMRANTNLPAVMVAEHLAQTIARR